MLDPVLDYTNLFKIEISSAYNGLLQKLKIYRIILRSILGTFIKKNNANA